MPGEEALEPSTTTTTGPNVGTVRGVTTLAVRGAAPKQIETAATQSLSETLGVPVSSIRVTVTKASSDLFVNKAKQPPPTERWVVEYTIILPEDRPEGSLQKVESAAAQVAADPNAQAAFADKLQGELAETGVPKETMGLEVEHFDEPVVERTALTDEASSDSTSELPEEVSINPAPSRQSSEETGSQSGAPGALVWRPLLYSIATLLVFTAL